MKLSVHLHRSPGEPYLAELGAALHPDIELTIGPDLPSPPAYHIFIEGHPSREHLTASPNLHTVIIPWAGIFEDAHEVLSEFPHLAVHNLHHNALFTAELAFALLLAAAKFIVPIDRALRGHDWTPRYLPNPSIHLDGKTALILGYGSIGRRVARMCRGMGMHVVATRRSITTPSLDGPDELYPAHALHDLLPRATALMICVPLTPDTNGLIGPAELARLPAEAMLVNVSRGAIVDEEALYHALRDGRLHAAGLDVWYNYPADKASRANTPPSAYPFHELDNVVMSPHRGGHSRERERFRMEHLARLLNAAARGEPIPNRVDLERWY